jgi:hypothetical protein
MNAADDAVLATNKAFYSAFRDFDKMNALWAYDGTVFCLHPGQEPILDRAAIMASWQEVCGEQLNITPANEKVLWFGDAVVVVCEEVIDEKPSDVTMIASNVFVRMYAPGGWGVAGHHAGRKGRKEKQHGDG